MEDTDFMLTTFDNPFNPFTDFETWWKEDLRLGHDTSGLLAKTSGTSEIYSDNKNSELIDRAMDEIIERWPMIFKKVLKKDFK